MGFKLRIPLGDGVKLNINRKSVSVSAGTKGARVAANSKGFLTTTLGNIFSGVSYSKRTNLKRKKKKK
ncbi:DUF4236 domain-containing protein [Heyndrickxia ginsengihumi]|uniref:DUF4236 domain-containing protein n=1 Tax=Heyndrickxia ginsengihumi TaxID=363870 RepID=UPI00047289C5|nr:DUF4236 domain-containing protein [Heyndrickxia ginsengihumi]